MGGAGRHLNGLVGSGFGRLHLQLQGHGTIAANGGRLLDGNTGGLDFNGCRFAFCSFLYGILRVIFRTRCGDCHRTALHGFSKCEEEHAGVLDLWII